MTNNLHTQQEALWGWHDLRRKSAARTDSRCRANIKGRCARTDCCCHWAPATPKPKPWTTPVLRLVKGRAVN
jgi:hypothetical protein